MPRYPLLPTPFDDVTSNTSRSQISTEIDITNILLSWLDQNDDDQSIPSHKPVDSVALQRSSHIAFIYPKLSKLPPRFVALDAARAWTMYWITGALSLLDAKLKQDERSRAIETVLSFQHPDGGFGGGPGQIAHLASTLASICSLTILLDGADPDLVEKTCAQVHVTKLYDWILSLKMPDGSFAVHPDGEIDVRACYAALSVATLLNILTPDLVRNVPEYLLSCQNYEGGMSATSFSSHQSSAQGVNFEFPEVAPSGEAHGGYASCVVASHFLLQALPSLSASPKLDYDSCLRWAAQMQGLPVEGGGFRGRTNKLVDGCYSWWCGEIFPLLRALIASDSFDPGELFDRQALQEYILLISQDLSPDAKQGGLRDKPSLPPDAYHTYYILAGLSLAQHSQTHSPQRVQDLKEKFKPPDCSKCIFGEHEAESDGVERMKEIYSRALGWEVEDAKQLVVGLVSNKLLPVHPVLNVKQAAAEKFMNYFYHQM